MLNTDVFVVSDAHLKLAKSLNESSARFNVSACCQSTCAITSVVVELIDSNNNAPEFEKNAYEGTIREDALPGTVVRSVQAFDLKDRVASQKLDYFILNGDELNQFAISSDGKVYTRLPIDREQLHAYTFTILAFDGKYKATTKLRVNVLDVDDSRPVCVDNLVRLNISEAIRVDSSVYTVNAVNPDLQKLNYEIIAHEQNEAISSKRMPFSVSEQGHLRTNSALDFEQEKSYVFYVRVSKWGESAEQKRVSDSSYCLVKFQINVIDENDNKPAFKVTNYVSQLLENSPRGSILQNATQVFAFDLDSRLNGMVRFSLQNHTDLFEIDPKSGLISLAIPNLDRESVGDWVNLTIRAADSSASNQLFAECSMLINILDVNDNKPVFERDFNYISLQENSPIGFLITRLIASDPDLNSTTEYYLLNQTDAEKFSVNPLTGDVYVNSSLDFERKNQFILQIAALDPQMNKSLDANSSITKLIIDLLDVNDHAPQFHPLTPQSLSVDENVPVNTTLHVFKATDSDLTHQNNELKFTIVQGNEQGFFGLNEKTGRLYTHKVYDYETNEIHAFNLVIQCEDKGEPTPLKSDVILTVNFHDLNDNEPVFTRKNQTLIFKESYPLGQEITQLLVSDADEVNGGAPFTFAVIDQFRNLVEVNFDNENNQSQPKPPLLDQLVEPIFGVSPNGSLVLIKKPISNQTYHVRVRCYDSGVPSLHADTFLTVKVTDDSSNEPKMNHTQIEIVTIGDMASFDADTFSRVLPGQYIGQLTAQDLDNDSLVFDFDKEAQTTEETWAFRVNSLDGRLQTRHELAQTQQFELKATASDSKFVSVANLNVNVENIDKNCVVNSLFIKLNFRPSSNNSDEISNEKLVSHGYLKRFKDTIIRLINYQKLKTKSSSMLKQHLNYTKLNVLFLSLKVSRVVKDENTFVPSEILDDSYEHDEDSHNTEFYQEPVDGSIVELIFSVRSDHDTCLDAVFLSKLLNKRKSLIVKKVKTISGLSLAPYKLRIVDFLYNQECSTQSVAICTTNVAFQNCKLKLVGYNDPSSLCELNMRSSVTRYIITEYIKDFAKFDNDVSFKEWRPGGVLKYPKINESGPIPNNILKYKNINFFVIFTTFFYQYMKSSLF